MSETDNLKSFVADWKLRFSGGDEHSITKQLADMLWRSAFYRSVNESRRFLPDEKDGGKKANGVLHQLIDEGYVVLNATAIRRLLDKGATSGPRGVYSLHGLIRDIKARIKLITRKNVLEARDLEYDFEPIKHRAHEQARRTQASIGVGAHFVSRNGWALSEYWHGRMDEICGVSAGERSPEDTPDESKLDRLLGELEEHGQSIQDWVDKFVAHAASPESRQTLSAEHQTLSLATLWRSERILVRVANFISYSFVDGANIATVPLSSFNQFAFLDRTFIESTALERMRKVWEQHCEEIQACGKWSWNSPLIEKSDDWTE